jgi:alpha-tubulin suppressor-like RCC1 family protein
LGALTTWLSISAGMYYTISAKTDGTLWSWGQNNQGQLGLNNITAYSSPKQVGALTNWLSVAGGQYNVASIKMDGTLWMWGLNGNGQLGLGNVTKYSSPKQVGSIITWSKVTCAPNFTIALG